MQNGYGSCLVGTVKVSHLDDVAAGGIIWKAEGKEKAKKEIRVISGTAPKLGQMTKSKIRNGFG